MDCLLVKSSSRTGPPTVTPSTCPFTTSPPVKIFRRVTWRFRCPILWWLRWREYWATRVLLDQQRGRGQLAVESPLLWSQSELDYLTGSPIKDEVLERAKGIKREYNELDTVWFMAGSLFRVLVYDGFISGVDLNLIPSCFNYGFVDEDNSYDRLVVKAALRTEDPQYQDKRIVAQRNGKLSIQAFNVYAGKEREAVLEMLPNLRLGYVSDPAEMQSVISSRGPICPVSSCMERAVLDQLVDYFESRLAGYPTTLSDDDSLLSDPNLNQKKRVATQLVRLEKRMLTACLQAAIDLMKVLPDHTISPCPAPFAPQLR